MKTDEVQPAPQQGGQNSRKAPRKFEVDDFDQKAIFLCQFCGGDKCDQENYLKNKILPNAIEGLHSNWITDNILAMQRPSERLIKEYNLYGKFKEKNIRTVLNLQEPGEHPFCGDGIISTVGFSYIPENFYYHGIHCFNESWQDMTATTFEHMMKIMNLFDMSLADGGKISVHCHAGRGRTLLVICSWLIYWDRMSAQATIDLAVAKRQGVLTRGSQRQFLHYFEEQLKQRWKSYNIAQDIKSFSEFVDWQTVSLLNREKKQLHNTSIMHFKLMQQLRIMLKTDQNGVVQSLLNPNGLQFKEKWGEIHEVTLQKLKKEFNHINFKDIVLQSDPRIIVQLLYDFYESFPVTLVTSITVDCLIQQFQKEQHKNQPHVHLKILLQPAIVHNLGVASLATILDFLHFFNAIKHLLDRSLKEKEESIVQEESKVNHNIIQSLYVRLAIMLLSKKKYLPQLFPTATPRDCKIYKYCTKIGKAVSKHVIFLANFLKNLAEELPEELEDIHKLVFKACKVDSNLYYLTKQLPNRYLSGQEKKEIYDSARIKLKK